MTTRIKGVQIIIIIALVFGFTAPLSAQSTQDSSSVSRSEHTLNVEVSKDPVINTKDQSTVHTWQKECNIDADIGSVRINTSNHKGIERSIMAGAVNVSSDTIRGVQMAAFGNVASGKVIGTQIAGAFNVNNGSVEGVQVSGLANVVTDTVQGSQIAGISNVVLHTEGFQGAGISNISKDVKGVQLAGCVNIAENEVEGAQLAGYFNYAKKLNGVQIGYINISDTVESGVPIGFFSYVRKGFHQVELSYSDPRYL